MIKIDFGTKSKVVTMALPEQLVQKPLEEFKILEMLTRMPYGELTRDF